VQPKRRRRSSNTFSPNRPALRYAIIGAGLIGTSIGLAVRRSMPKAKVVGYDRVAMHARSALRRKALTSVATSIESAVAHAQVILIAVPRRNVVSLLSRVLRSAPAGAIVLDVAGLKAEIVAAGRRGQGMRAAVFVGGHPMAGTEKSGPDFARGDLFVRRTFALCLPPRLRRSDAVRQAEIFVRTLGAHPLHLSPREHDRVVAATSALPQVVASAVAGAAANLVGKHAALAGPGLDGVIRLAASPPAIWTDDLIANKRNVLRALGVLERKLHGFRLAIAAGERTRLRRLLSAGTSAQRRLSLRRQVFLSRTE